MGCPGTAAPTGARGRAIILRDEVFSRTIRQGIRTKTACGLGITRQPRRLGSVTLGRPVGVQFVRGFNLSNHQRGFHLCSQGDQF